MSFCSSLFAFILLFISFNATCADNFFAPKSKPTFYHSAALQNYVKKISDYQPESNGLKKRLQKTILYYKKIHITKTIIQGNNIIDCIPFAEQPALINNPGLAESILPFVREITAKNILTLKKMKSTLDLNPASQCPLGAVAILRPSQIILTSKRANKKQAPTKHFSDYYSSLNFHGGYSYELGADSSNNLISIQTEANQAYFKAPQNQSVVSNNFSDHSLNQFWFTNDTYQQSIPVYSVEFGIIASAYFTNPASTSIFVFASVDNYGNNSCYNVECPNFVQFPNTIVLGAPTNTQIDYLFQVTHTTLNQYLNSPAYYLTLTMHNSSSTNANNSSSILLGYYADSIYPSYSDLPQYFSAGAEVYADQPHDGTLMNGNYMTPYVGYSGSLQIQFSTENHNSFPYYTSNGPSPYGLIWHFGQTE